MIAHTMRHLFSKVFKVRIFYSLQSYDVVCVCMFVKPLVNSVTDNLVAHHTWCVNEYKNPIEFGRGGRSFEVKV